MEKPPLAAAKLSSEGNLTGVLPYGDSISYSVLPANSQKRQEYTIMSTLQQAATADLKSIKRLTPRTQKGYRQRLGVFIEWCENNHITLQEIRNVAVDDFVEHLRAHHHSAYHSRSEVSTHTL